ncbi:hypothetical protein KC338_g29 [Hortaea werneckii]|nr:hypothetical protein KC338_g29 [Hortaea werneckii]
MGNGNSRKSSCRWKSSQSLIRCRLNRVTKGMMSEPRLSSPERKGRTQVRNTDQDPLISQIRKSPNPPHTTRRAPRSHQLPPHQFRIMTPILQEPKHAIPSTCQIGERGKSSRGRGTRSTSTRLSKARPVRLVKRISTASVWMALQVLRRFDLSRQDHGVDLQTELGGEGEERAGLPDVETCRRYCLLKHVRLILF